MAHMMTSGGVLATAVATAALAVLATGPASAASAAAQSAGVQRTTKVALASERRWPDAVFP